MATSVSGLLAPDAALDVPFVGRDIELAELCALVAAPEVDIVELVGEPGVGKSRLARRLLDVLTACAQQGNQQDDEDHTPDVALLDDAHLLPPRDKARRIEELRAPGRTVIVTDRRAGAGTATTVIVCPLPVPEDYSLLDVEAAARVPSVELLVALRRRVQPSFVLDAASLPATARLCGHFRGVPLDLRVATSLLTAVDADLVASPAAAVSPTALAVVTQFRVQHGLRDAVDVATSLSADACSTLAAASLAVDGLGREALARITDLAAPQLNRATTELSDHALLVGSEQASAGPDGHGGHGGLVRARFHVPVTALPVVAAVVRPDTAETFLHRHSAYHLDVVASALEAVDGRDQASGFAVLSAERSNIAVALDHLVDEDPDRAVDVVIGLRTYWRALGLVFDVQAQVERLTGHAHLLDPGHAAGLELAVADAEARLGEPELAAASLQHALDLGADAEGPDVLVTQGVLDLTASVGADETALVAGVAALRRAGRIPEADRAALMVALHALFDARPADGAAICRQILPDARRRADHLTSGAALLRISACHAALGDPVGADEYWSRAMVHLRQLGFAVTLGQIAEVVGSSVQHNSRTRGVRVTELIGAMVDERRAVSSATEEPAFVIGAFEELMLQVLGPVDFASAWSRGRASTPADLVSAIARGAMAEIAPGVVPPVVVGETVVAARSAVVDDVAQAPQPGSAATERFACWSELTPRETEVALLVAEGLFNRQVARQLSISEWTVVNHMRAVLKKLELRSRVQLARWVAERAAAHAGTAAGTDLAPVPATEPV